MRGKDSSAREILTRFRWHFDLRAEFLNRRLGASVSGSGVLEMLARLVRQSLSDSAFRALRQI